MATYIQKDNQQLGPFDDGQILAALRSGEHSPSELGWQDSMTGWLPLGVLFPPPNQPPSFPVSLYGPGSVQAERLGDNVGMRLLLPVGRSGWAIAAGYLGLFSILLLPAPLALICAILGIREIRRSRTAGADGQKYGMGRAVFGLILGGLGTLVLLTLTVASLLRKI